MMTVACGKLGHIESTCPIEQACCLPSGQGMPWPNARKIQITSFLCFSFPLLVRLAVDSACQIGQTRESRF
jgi:hypothetical protein